MKSRRLNGPVHRGFKRAMGDSSAFGLHRPEYAEPLNRGEAAIAQLMRTQGQTLNFVPGEVIVEGGETHERVYRLTQGWVSRVRTLADGRQQGIVVFLPGDLFAVKALYFTRQPDAILASTAVVAQAIGYRALGEAAQRDPDISLRLVWQLMEDERRLHNHVVMLGKGSARERLAALLVDLRGRLVLSGALAAGAQRFSTPFTQEELGDLVGLSTIHVNRVLRELREAGVATVRRGRVQIDNPEALGRLALPMLDVFQRTNPAFDAAAGPPDRKTPQRV